MIARDQITGSLSSGALDRRAALKLFVSGAALALSSCGRPAQEIVPYVDTPGGEIAGVPLHFATALPLSGYGRGVIVTSVQGRPIKINGNPAIRRALAAPTYSRKLRCCRSTIRTGRRRRIAPAAFSPGAPFWQHCCRVLLTRSHVKAQGWRC